ncbi:hypothetical protein IWQ48_002814 [Labrenzia sp. EL_13]|nr:hypothetical protein [Labrenzia sp. EL_195]MBG6201676.1 hypothetical protein [Labrenzia sp. EL_13]
MYELPIVLGGFAPTSPTYVPLGPGEASRLFNAIEANDLSAEGLSYVRSQRTTSLGPGGDCPASSTKPLKWAFTQSRRIVAFGPLRTLDHAVANVLIRPILGIGFSNCERSWYNFAAG